MFIVLGEVVHIGSQTLTASLRLRPVAHSLTSVGKQLGGWLGLPGLGGLVGYFAYKRQLAEQKWEQEARLRRESTAYLTLDLPLCSMERSEYARLMSRTIATRSSFARAAVMLRDSSGVLAVAGSAGVDDVSVDALNRWGARATANPNPAEEPALGEANRVGACSFAVRLERRSPESYRDRAAALSCAEVHVVPITSGSSLLGAMIVCAEARPTLRPATSKAQLRLMLEPIEALALRLGTEWMQVSAAPGPKRVKLTAVRTRERAQERHRARAAHSQGHAASAHGVARVSRERATQLHEFAPELFSLHRPAGVVTGFPSAKLWRR